MSNIHGLSSLNNNRNDRNDDDNEDENNRYVGGISARGGGSGLAVEPNPNDHPTNSNHDNDILGAIRANAQQAQPPTDPSSSSSSSRRRMITMYRSGFTVDNGPFRRLDDPTNADFLRDLARGRTPIELASENDTASNNIEVGLVDKRHLEYEDDVDVDVDVDVDGESTTASAGTAAFAGVGNALGGGTTTTAPSSSALSPTITSTSTSTSPPTPDETKPMTTIQIRLHTSNKKLIIKCNLTDTIHILTLHIAAAAQGAGQDPYVLVSGYPPKVLDDLNQTIEEAGLKNAQVVQKKV